MREWYAATAAIAYGILRFREAKQMHRRKVNHAIFEGAYHVPNKPFFPPEGES